MASPEERAADTAPHIFSSLIDADTLIPMAAARMPLARHFAVIGAVAQFCALAYFYAIFHHIGPTLPISRRSHDALAVATGEPALMLTRANMRDTRMRFRLNISRASMP